MFFKLNGGMFRDENGKQIQFRLWWVMAVGSIVDSILRTLVGKGTIGLPSTMTVVGRSMNTHSPVDQKISMCFVDADNPKRLIWGTELTADGARQVAGRLIMLAEEVEPLYSREDYLKTVEEHIAQLNQLKAGMNDQTH